MPHCATLPHRLPRHPLLSRHDAYNEESAQSPPPRQWMRWSCTLAIADGTSSLIDLPLCATPVTPPASPPLLCRHNGPRRGVVAAAAIKVEEEVGARLRECR